MFVNIDRNCWADGLNEDYYNIHRTNVKEVSTSKFEEFYREINNERILKDDYVL